MDRVRGGQCDTQERKEEQCFSISQLILRTRPFHKSNLFAGYLPKSQCIKLDGSLPLAYLQSLEENGKLTQGLK